MAGSKDDATSSDILEAADKLTDIDKMKEALDKLCHEEASKITLFASTPMFVLIYVRLYNIYKNN